MALFVPGRYVPSVPQPHVVLGRMLAYRVVFCVRAVSFCRALGHMGMPWRAGRVQRFPSFGMAEPNESTYLDT